MAFIGILPGDISPNIIMEMDKPGFETYTAIKKYTLRLVKVLQHQKRRGRSFNLVDAYQQGAPSADSQGDYGEQEERTEQAEFEHELAEIYSLGLAPEEQAVEVNALMNKRFSRYGSPRGRSVQPPQRGAGFRGHSPDRPAPPCARRPEIALTCNA